MSLLTLGITANTDRAPSGTNLLDLYPGAAGAWALWRLRSAATVAIRIVRDSDNAEMEIGFVGDDINMTAIADFSVGTRSRIIRVIDQTGNGNDLIMPTILNQPLIYDSGAVITENGKAAIEYQPSNSHWMQLTSPITSANDWTMFHVTRRRVSGQIGLMGLSSGTSSAANSVYGAWIYNDNNVYARNRDGFESASLNVASQQLLTTVSTNGNIDVYNNGNLVATAFTSTSATPNFTAYGRRDSDFGNGWKQALIHYSNNQSSNRVAIENLIKTYYGIP